MTKFILAEAIGNISDRHILEGLSAIHKRKHIKAKTIIKILAAAMVCLACFICIKTALNSSDHHHNSNEKHYYIQSTDKITENANLSRTGLLTPLAPNCRERQMTKDDLRRFFQCSDFDLFHGQSADCVLILNEDKSIHTVRMTWFFNEGAVCAVFDPNTYPEFLFDSADSTKDEFCDYQIAVQKTKTADTNYEIDIGLKQDSVGIWIFGNEECKDKMEDVMNYIFKHPVSFDLD